MVETPFSSASGGGGRTTDTEESEETEEASDEPESGDSTSEETPRGRRRARQQMPGAGLGSDDGDGVGADDTGMADTPEVSDPEDPNGPPVAEEDAAPGTPGAGGQSAGPSSGRQPDNSRSDTPNGGDRSDQGDGGVDGDDQAGRDTDPLRAPPGSDSSSSQGPPTASEDAAPGTPGSGGQSPGPSSSEASADDTTGLSGTQGDAPVLDRNKVAAVESTRSPSSPTQSAAGKADGLPTVVPDMTSRQDSGTNAAQEFVKNAEVDDAVADLATSGGFSRLAGVGVTLGDTRLEVPTVDVAGTANELNVITENRNLEVTATAADVPFVGQVPAGLQIDLGKEQSQDTARDEFVEGLTMSLNPASAVEDVENVAEVADSPGALLRDPSATAESATAAGRNFGSSLARTARENPAGLAGSLAPALVGAGAAASSVRGAGSVRAAAKAELDPRVGPFGTTAGTKAVRGLRNRVSDLPTPDNNRGSLQLGKFRRRGGDGDDSNMDVDADDADSDLGVPDDPFLESDARVRDPARSFDRENDPNVDVDPTDPSGESLDDIQGGISGRGEPQAAPGVDLPEGGFSERGFGTTTGDADAGTVATAADADTPAVSGVGPVKGGLFGLSALDEAGQPQATTAADNLEATDSALLDDPATSADSTDAGTTGTLPFAEDTTTAVDTTADVGVGTGTTLFEVGETGSDLFDDTDTGADVAPGLDQPTGVDTPVDTGTDTPVDIGTDTPVDTGTDTPPGLQQDPPTNTPTDRPFDQGTDTPFDPGQPNDRDMPQPTDLPGPDAQSSRDDDDDRLFSGLFNNPTISSGQAFDFNPFGDASGDSSMSNGDADSSIGDDLDSLF